MGVVYFGGPSKHPFGILDLERVRPHAIVIWQPHSARRHLHSCRSRWRTLEKVPFAVSPRHETFLISSYYNNIQNICTTQSSEKEPRHGCSSHCFCWNLNSPHFLRICRDYASEGYESGAEWLFCGDFDNFDSSEWGSTHMIRRSLSRSCALSWCQFL